MDSLEGVIGLVWLMFLVGSVLRAVVQGKRRAEQEAARRAMRRAQGQPRQAPAPGGQIFRPGWPVYPGQPAQPVIVVEDGESHGEGESGGEGEPAEGDSREARRRLKQERSDEWQSERARTWEMPADAGSLGDPGEAVDEPIAKSADAFGVDLSREALDLAVDEDTAAEADKDMVVAGRLEGAVGVWQLPGRVEPEHALAGIVWGTVLGEPRCRLTRHRR